MSHRGLIMSHLTDMTHMIWLIFQFFLLHYQLKMDLKSVEAIPDLPLEWWEALSIESVKILISSLFLPISYFRKSPIWYGRLTKLFQTSSNVWTMTYLMIHQWWLIIYESFCMLLIFFLRHILLNVTFYLTINCIWYRFNGTAHTLRESDK